MLLLLVKNFHLAFYPLAHFRLCLDCLSDVDLELLNLLGSSLELSLQFQVLELELLELRIFTGEVLEPFLKGLLLLLKERLLLLIVL